MFLPVRHSLYLKIAKSMSIVAKHFSSALLETKRNATNTEVGIFISEKVLPITEVHFVESTWKLVLTASKYRA